MKSLLHSVNNPLRVNPCILIITCLGFIKGSKHRTNLFHAAKLILQILLWQWLRIYTHLLARYHNIKHQLHFIII